MRYSFATQRVFAAYDEARIVGGAMTDTGWVDFDELQVPEGYVENWRELLDEPARAVQPSERSVSPHLDFREYGRRGGMKTKTTHPPEYYREIGRLGGRGNRR